MAVMATRPLFTSPRERRLWLATAAVMVAIYSTLGVAGSIADELRERNLLRASFALFGVVVLVVAWRWLKQRPGWSELGVALGVALAFLLVASRASSWEERTHLIEYGIVAALIHQALLERVRNGREVPWPAALTIGVTSTLGVVDECIQAVLPSRVFDPRDIFFNAFAGFMVVAARLAIAEQHRVGWRVWFLWMLATAIGWGQGVYIGWFEDSEPVFLEVVPSNQVAGYTGLIVGGFWVGLLQWLILRAHIDRAGAWVLATVGACAVAGLVMVGVGAFDADLGWYVGVSIFGIALGVLQWVVLRTNVPNAGWWILVSTVGWAVALPFGDLNGPPGLGGLYGVVTATALVRLLRQERTFTPS